jgi:hypothetical protein
VAQDVEFQEFFAGQYEALCRLGYWLTGDRGAGEELAQEALVRVCWRWAIVNPTRRAAGDQQGDRADRRRRAMVKLAARDRAPLVVAHQTGLVGPGPAPPPG